MQYFDWDPDKNAQLKAERGICFEDVIIAWEEDRVLDIVEHPNQKKYPGQLLIVVHIQNYAYIVPCV